jgi:hypothetical protein
MRSVTPLNCRRVILLQPLSRREVRMHSPLRLVAYLLLSLAA